MYCFHSVTEFKIVRMAKMSPIASWGNVLAKNSNAMMVDVYHRYGFAMATTIAQQTKMRLIAMHATVLRMNLSKHWIWKYFFENMFIEHFFNPTDAIQVGVFQNHGNGNKLIFIENQIQIN